MKTSRALQLAAIVVVSLSVGLPALADNCSTSCRNQYGSDRKGYDTCVLSCRTRERAQELARKAQEAARKAAEQARKSASAAKKGWNSGRKSN